MEATFIYRSNWWGYIGKRVLIAIIVFFMVSLMIFYITNYQGLYIEIFPGPKNISSAQLEKLYEQLGVDTSPLIVRYFRYMGDFFTGDWGKSLYDESYYFK